MRKKTFRLLLILFLGILLALGTFLFFNQSKATKIITIKPNISPVPRKEKVLNVFMTSNYYKSDLEDRYRAYQKRNPEMPVTELVNYVNIGLDQAFYTNIKAAKDPNSLGVLVNKYHSLSSSYVPLDLTVIKSAYASGTQRMQKEAARAFENLAEAARKEGYTINAISTYRSYDYQKNLYNKYLTNDSVASVDRYSARAGHSEHQTGLAVDVNNNSSTYTSFDNTKDFIWMKDNAHLYGYILRYPKDKTMITGYKYEPWHYRYLGVEIATYIYNNSLTYEEYIVTRKK